jgi:hypothetical protein
LKASSKGSNKNYSKTHTTKSHNTLQKAAYTTEYRRLINLCLLGRSKKHQLFAPAPDKTTRMLADESMVGISIFFQWSPLASQPRHRFGG